MEAGTKRSLHCQINNDNLLKHYASLNTIRTAFKRRANVNDFEKFHKKMDPLDDRWFFTHFFLNISAVLSGCHGRVQQRNLNSC